MNTTQWKFYNFLKQKANEDPTHWVTHQEICDAMPDEFTMNHLAVNKLCCSNIQSIVLQIYEAGELDKIIMFKNQTYRLACNREEALKFIQNKLLNKGCRILKRYWQLLDKINNDGQMKLLSNRGDIIDSESKAREYIEAYVTKKAPKPDDE